MSILNYKDSSQITFSCLPRPKKRSVKCEKDAGYSPALRLQNSYYLIHKFVQKTANPYTRLSLRHFVSFNSRMRHFTAEGDWAGRVILANVLKRPEYTGECQSCFSINPKCLKSYRYLIVGDPKKGELIFRRAVNRWKEARTQEREDEPTFFKLCSDFKWFAQEMS